MSLASRSLFNGTALVRACLMASLTLGAGMTTEAAQPLRPGYHFSFAGKRPTFREEFVRPEIVVSAADSEGRLSVIDEIWSPGFHTPAHYHMRHAETFYIASGQVEWTVGGETQLLKAGDLVHIPAYTVHTTRVVGSEAMHTLMVFEPGGFEEGVWLRASLTPEQLKDPKIQKQLEAVGDFNIPDANTHLATQPVEHFSFAGKRPYFENDGTSEVALSTRNSGGRLTIEDEVWKAGYSLPPHFHTTHAETYYVLDGRAEWTVGGEKHVLTRGDGVYIGPNIVHSVKALDNKPVHTVLFYYAGGYDDHLEAQAVYSAEELMDPAVTKLVRAIGDFHLVRE